jgi:hypothetical protein
LEGARSKLEQCFDIILDYKLQGAEDLFENVIYKHCAQGDCKNLPPPFGLKSELPVPFLMRLIIIPTKSPENGDPDAQYINTIKHIYMHKNKLPVNICTEACRGVAHWWDHGRHFRVGCWL